MDDVFLTINQNGSHYDSLLINRAVIIRIKDIINGSCSKETIGSGDSKKASHNVVQFKWNGILAYYIVQELMLCDGYRRAFVENLKEREADEVRIYLTEADRQIIDYRWNERTTHMAWERLELEHALSWLSTLGGAFSALGDCGEMRAAQMAGRISLHQLRLAMRLGDEDTQARCRLFAALSLTQQGRLRDAARIVRSEHARATSATLVDRRLVNMCLGIWARLQYEQQKRKLISRLRAQRLKST